MGNRSECPACKAYTSDVYAALHYNHGDCPYCGCPHELLVEWDEMQPQLNELRENKVRKDLVDRLNELSQENAQLKTKIHKMYDLLAWKDINELFEPIIKVKEILESEIRE